MNRRALGGMLLGLFVGASGCAETPEKTADRFVDLYFVEAEQARARPLAVGLAEKKLDDELRLVGDVRRTAGGAQPRPTVYWKRRAARVDGERAHVTYDLTIRFGGDESKKHAMLSLERVGDGWRVANWQLSDGALP